MQHYPAEMKLDAIRQFYEEGRTQAEIIKGLGIRDHNRVKVWLEQYRREGYGGFSKPIGRPCKQVESLQTELKRLQMDRSVYVKMPFD